MLVSHDLRTVYAVPDACRPVPDHWGGEWVDALDTYVHRPEPGGIRPCGPVIHPARGEDRDPQGTTVIVRNVDIGTVPGRGGRVILY